MVNCGFLLFCFMIRVVSSGVRLRSCFRSSLCSILDSVSSVISDMFFCSWSLCSRVLIDFLGVVFVRVVRIIRRGIGVLCFRIVW